MQKIAFWRLWLICAKMKKTGDVAKRDSRKGFHFDASGSLFLHAWQRVPLVLRFSSGVTHKRTSKMSEKTGEALRVVLYRVRKFWFFGNDGCVVTSEKTEATTSARTPTTPPAATAMSSNATHATETPMEGVIATHAHQIDAEEAFPGLPNHVVIQHILRSGSDPIVLARLREVNRTMRDAVDSTGLRVMDTTSEEAAQLGCLETLKHKLKTGRLNRAKVCSSAAKGGQLEVLQWARANGCQWDAGP